MENLRLTTPFFYVSLFYEKTWERIIRIVYNLAKEGNMKKSFILVGIITLLSLFGTAQSKIWYVHPDSSLNKIQAGLDSSATGDTVLVAPGTYFENIFWPLVNSIKLFSELGSDTTIIDGSSSSCVIYFSGMATIDTTTVISGFTIQNGGGVTNGGGICLVQSSPKIENNKIINNSANNGGGIYCGNFSSPVITGNNINNCSGSPSHGGGIYCADGSNPKIISNTVSNNTNNGICCYSSSGCRISNNQITGNNEFGIYCCGSPKILNNRISNNSPGGIVCNPGSNPEISGDTISHNSGYGGGIICYECSPTITDNQITDNAGCGIKCCWAGSPTISGNTIISNDSSGIYCDEWANPIIISDTISGNQGRGICNVGYASLTITDNKITNNYDGGISGNVSQITRNYISGNQTSGNGGGICCSGSPSIRYNTIEGNNADGLGDGIYSSSCTAVINHNNIYNNGYGVYNPDNAQMLNAEYNWWGDPTGPYHPTLNPDGLGDSTNMFVDPIPFLTDPSIKEGICRQNPPASIVKQNYPNPFNSVTRISYYCFEPSQVTIKIYNLAGQEVVKLTDELKSPGEHVALWDASEMSAGVYFYKVTIGNFTETRKCLLVR